MWTEENRGRYDRGGLRYPSDLTDEEWALVKPEIPRAKRGGNKRTVDVREVEPRRDCRRRLCLGQAAVARSFSCSW